MNLLRTKMNDIIVSAKFDKDTTKAYTQSHLIKISFARDYTALSSGIVVVGGLAAQVFDGDCLKVRVDKSVTVDSIQSACPLLLTFRGSLSE